MVKKFLTRSGTAVLEQPPYLPDLAPCNFWLFDKVKDAMRADHLGSIEAIKQELSRILNAIPEIKFQQFFEHWRERSSKCIATGGEYFEGDRSILSE